MPLKDIDKREGIKNERQKKKKKNLPSQKVNKI